MNLFLCSTLLRDQCVESRKWADWNRIINTNNMKTYMTIHI